MGMAMLVIKDLREWNDTRRRRDGWSKTIFRIWYVGKLLLLVLNVLECTMAQEVWLYSGSILELVRFLNISLDEIVYWFLISFWWDKSHF